MKKNSMKKFAALLMAMILTLTLIPDAGIVKADGSDTTAPEITGVEFLSNTVNAGQTVKVRVSFTEEGTGVSSISLTVSHVNTYKGGAGENQVANVQLFNLSVPTGNNSIDIDVPISGTAVNGQWIVKEIDITDKANNHSHLGTTPEWNEAGDEISRIVYSSVFIGTSAASMTVQGGLSDLTAPAVTNIEFLSASVNTGEKAKVRIWFTEEDTGLTNIWIKLRQKDSLLNFSASPNEETTIDATVAKLNTGYVDVEIPISSNAVTGQWYIDSFTLTDYAGNFNFVSTSFFMNDESETPEIKEIKYPPNSTVKDVAVDEIEVKKAPDSGPVDTTAPKITGVSLLANSVYRPGVAKVRVYFTEEGSGVVNISVNLAKKDALLNFSLGVNEMIGGQIELQKAKTGYADINVPITANTFTGVYMIYSLSIVDAGGNQDYIWTSYKTNDEYTEITETSFSGSLANVPVEELKIKDEIVAAFEVSLSNTQLPEKLTDMNEGETAKVLIDDSSTGVVTGSVFEAIKGKDKNVVFYTQTGQQWIFNGKDITEEIKDIDLRFRLRVVPASDYSSEGDTIQIDFANNGVLPGKAQIRIKSDYLYNLYGTTGQLFLYSDKDGKWVKEDNPNFDLEFDGTDKWCNFDITHNSSYLISSDPNLAGHDMTTIAEAEGNVGTGQNETVLTKAPQTGDSILIYVCTLCMGAMVLSLSLYRIKRQRTH